MNHFIPLHSCNVLYKILTKTNVATDEGNSRNEISTLNERSNWSSWTKLALSACWTHGLITQLIRASERNSVVVGLNPTQANFHSYF